MHFSVACRGLRCWYGGKDSLAAFERCKFEQEILQHILNEIKECLHEGGHEPRAVKIKKYALAENGSVLHGEQNVTCTERQSLQLPIESRVVSHERKKGKEQQIYLSRLDDKDVAIALTIPKAALNLKS